METKCSFTNDEYSDDANGSPLAWVIPPTLIPTETETLTPSATFTPTETMETSPTPAAAGMASFSAIVYTYDGNGVMVKSEMDGITTYYVGGYYELRVDENELETEVLYYHGGTGRFAMRTRTALTNELYWIFTDHLQSSSVILEENGDVYSKTSYTAFGEERDIDTTGLSDSPTDYKYTGQRSYVDDFGLHYYVARWYDPYLNHFIQPDSLIPQPGNSGDWDRYAYVVWNPIKYIDITGHEKVIIIYGTNYSQETNAFYAAAQTAYQNALDAGYKEEDILVVDVATDQDFYNAIYESEVGEIEQILFFGHGYASIEDETINSFIYISQANSIKENSDPAILNISDLNEKWRALADRFAQGSSITINACLVGTGSFPQALANTLDTTVYAYENSMQFYQTVGINSISIMPGGNGMDISFPIPYNGGGNYRPGVHVEMVPVWGGGIPVPYFFRQPIEFTPQ